MKSNRKRVFRIEIDPEDIKHLKDEEIKELLKSIISKSILGIYQFQVVKQPISRKAPYVLRHRPGQPL